MSREGAGLRVGEQMGSDRMGDDTSPEGKLGRRDDALADEGHDRWLSTTAAAAHLGVKPATLYAYVSRGLIDSHPAPEGRGSVFHRDDVRRLQVRGRGGGRVPDRDVVVHSSITEIRHNALYYRGHDATRLAGRHRFEAVAEWLWSDSVQNNLLHRGQDVVPGWAPSSRAVAVASGAQAALPASSSSLDRLRVITGAASTTDALRNDLRPEAVRRVGRQLIATLVEALPARANDVATTDRPATPDATIAERLWPKLTTRPADGRLVALLDSAMVLLADHELAASTLAARVAASARCDPYAVIECGLAAVGGSLHGATAGAVEQLLEGADAAQSLQRVGRQLRDQGRLPGFGHFAYPDGDPRARTLLRLLRETDPAARGLEAAEAVMAAAAERGLPAPTIDFALAALTTSVEMPIGSAEAVFGLARSAGWLAHALEQYEVGELIRPRAVYVGPS